MPKEYFMAKQQRTIGVFVIQLALAVYFIVTSLCIFGLGTSISEGEVKGITSLFGDAGKIINIVVGVLLMVCGVCFLIKAFGLDLGKFDDVVKYITLFVWIVVTVAALIYYTKPYDNHSGDFKNTAGILHWLLALAKNGLIIGGILTIKNGR